MHPLQNNDRPISIGEAFIQDRNAGSNDQNAIKLKITQANSVELLKIIKQYGVHLDEHNRKCICPFPFHANEKTASFFYYKNTNSFYCFGCKNGGGPVNFVSLFEDIPKNEAAAKITSKFQVDPNIIVKKSADFVDRQHLMLGFSELVRNFIFDNLDDKHALEYSEKVGLIFDTINLRHNLDNAGLKSLIKKLQIKLEQYKCQQH